MKKRNLSIFLIILLIKILSALYFIYLTKCTNPEIFIGIAKYAGDAASYITPIDNFINEGHYYFNTAKAGRMPYVGLVYLPFRLLFSKQIALSIVVILQVLMDSIAIYYMAKLCENIFKTSKAFWLFIALSCISLNASVFDYAIVSESFAISFLCLFAYRYYTYLTAERNLKQLLLAGIFLAITILFKPYFSLLFLLIGIEFLWHERHNFKKQFLKNIVKPLLFVALPLIIMDAPWTIRNYTVFNKFMPFQQDLDAGFDYTPADMAFFNFIQTIGESYIYWDKNSAGSYFQYNSGFPCEYKFPERIFGQNLTMRQIEDVRDVYMEYQKKPSDSLGSLTIKKFNTLSETYQNDHPFFYRFGTPFTLCKNFLINSGSYYLPIKKDSPCYHSYQWAIKLLQSLLYYLCLIIGFAGISILLCIKPKSFILFSIPVYLILLFPILLRRTECRYFTPSYPFLLIGLTYIILLLMKVLAKKKAYY